MIITNQICACPSAKFLSNNSISCISCPTTCTQCSNNGLNTAVCSQCTDSSHMSPSSQCTCFSGYFLMPSNYCQLCPLQCTACTAPTTGSIGYCTTCVDTNMGSPSSGACTCPANGYYISTGLTVCYSCPASCITCTNDNQNGYVCQTCQDTKMVITGGKCICPNGYFMSVSSKVCMHAHHHAQHA
jgi:hypothetical protein